MESLEEETDTAYAQHWLNFTTLGPLRSTGTHSTVVNPVTQEVISDNFFTCPYLAVGHQVVGLCCVATESNKPYN